MERLSNLSHSHQMAEVGFDLGPWSSPRDCLINPSGTNVERAQTQSQNAHLARDPGQPLSSPPPALFTYLMKWSLSSTLPFCPHPHNHQIR